MSKLTPSQLRQKAKETEGCTPGSWEAICLDHKYPGVEAKNFSVVIFGDNLEESGVQGRTRDEAIGNAQCLAAAPDFRDTALALLEENERLREALKTLAFRVEYQTQEMRRYDSLRPVVASLESDINRAREALAGGAQ